MKKNAAITFLILLFILGISLFGCGKSEPDFSISDVKVCHFSNPLGLDENPTFSWKMNSEKHDMIQIAYELCVADSLSDLEAKKYIWDSGLVNVSASINIPYEGSALNPKTRYFYALTVVDGHKHKQTINDWFETGLLGSDMENSEFGETALWVSAPENSEVFTQISEATVYDIGFDAEIDDTEMGFVFGAGEGLYGSMYLCRINNNPESAALSFLKMENGGYANGGEPLETFDITEVKTGNTFNIKLAIRDGGLLFYVNGKRVGVLENEDIPLGNIGYYKIRSAKYAYIDNLLITDENGNEILSETFENACSIFEPYHIKVVDGRLRVGSGMMLTGTWGQPAPMFYRSFNTEEKSIASARIYMTALGNFEVMCNGQKVSDDYFMPGKLLYNQELSYVTMDITDLLKEGENAIGITLLHGWYDRAVGYPEIWNPWGDTNALKGIIDITYEDGSRQSIVTDEKFLCNTNGPVRFDDIYQGEIFDEHYRIENFATTKMSLDGFVPALTNAIDGRYDEISLVSKASEPIRCENVLTPVSVSNPSEGVYVYDFGQNFAGTCRVEFPKGEEKTYTLRYGEEINTQKLDDADDIPGTVWTFNLLTAKATDYFTSIGENTVFSPEYTYHGFRYLQIEGLPEEIPIDKVLGLPISSSLSLTGGFECSDEDINRYYQNSVWSQRSNFIDSPTDCAQRDERHGWAGDAQIFSKTASFHMDTYNFYRKYLKELRLLQTEAGSYSDMAPRCFGTEWNGKGGAASHNCWGDASIVICWNLYNQFGDPQIIEENFDSMCKWVDVLEDSSDNYIRYWDGYGDHLATEETPREIVDTAWCAHSAQLLSKMAEIIGKNEESQRYQTVYENFRVAWQKAFVAPYAPWRTQTFYILGLAFGLFDQKDVDEATQRLELILESGDYELTIGYAGISTLFPALSQNGADYTAYNILMRKEYPSLTYAASKGATTTFEHLAGYMENDDGTYRLDGSLNHYAYGSPVSWFYTDILGIKSDENDPGYHHIILEPKFTDKLSYAKGSYNSVYGLIESSWETENGTGVIKYSCTVPANTTATIKLPNSEPIEVGSGRYEYSVK